MSELVVAGVWQATTLVALGVKLIGTTEPDHRGWVNFRVDNSDGAAERLVADWERLSVPAGRLSEAYGQVVWTMRSAKKQW